MKRYRLKSTVTDKQLSSCALGFAAKFASLRSGSFELDEIRPGFGSAFPKPVLTGTTHKASTPELNGYRVPLKFCKATRSK